MAEVTGDVPAPSAPTAPPAPLLPPELSLRGLLEVGAHFGHQTRRWDPRMRSYIFGERNGIHILNLDATHSRLREALEFLRETVARGGKVLFVATKRQAQDAIAAEAQRAGQFYVNNRWLGGMLTNFRTVKRSIERFKEAARDPRERGEGGGALEEGAGAHRALGGQVPEVARRHPGDGPAPRRALRDRRGLRAHRAHRGAAARASRSWPSWTRTAIRRGSTSSSPATTTRSARSSYYCKLVADACVEGAALYNERVQAEVSDEARGRGGEAGMAAGGRRVVEIRQAPRRGRGARRRTRRRTRRRALGRHALGGGSPSAAAGRGRVGPGPGRRLRLRLR